MDVADAGVAGYPQDPESDDELIASTCDDAGIFRSNFQLLPDGGVLQQCGGSWLDEQTQQVAPASPAILRFGHANTALREDGIIDLDDAELHAFVDCRQAASGRTVCARMATGSRSHCRLKSSSGW